MTIKCTKEKSTKNINPFIGMLLLFTSIFLFIITTPIGLIYGIIYKLYFKSLTGIGELSLRISIALDQLGNVIMQDLFNQLLICKGGYKFGNRDETISSVLGKNVELNTLSKLGQLLNSILDFIEAGHSLNSIDYYIEPMEDIYKK